MTQLELDAAEFVKGFEGYLEKAAWDVNAWRLGHGSDTITLPNGTFRKVKQGDTTTRELAKLDLARRIGTEFFPRIIKKIGADAWGNLTDAAKIALVSLAYNYGNITKKAIVAAAQSGDMRKLAQSIVSATYDDNKSLPEKVRNVLRDRRKKEAQLILDDLAKNPSRSARGSRSGMFWWLVIAAIAVGVYFIFTIFF